MHRRKIIISGDVAGEAEGQLPHSLNFWLSENFGRKIRNFWSKNAKFGDE